MQQFNNERLNRLRVELEKSDMPREARPAVEAVLGLVDELMVEVKRIRELLED